MRIKKQQPQNEWKERREEVKMERRHGEGGRAGGREGGREMKD